jgi:Immunity protein 30
MKNNIIDALVAKLELLDLRLDSPNYFEDFEKIVREIGSLKDPSSIPALTRFFKDNSDDLDIEDLMWSIIHTIEIFDMDVYIEKILEISPHICENSPRWASIVFMRILNSDKYKIELIQQLRQASPIVKENVKELMGKINKVNLTFLAKTTPILIAASL